MGSYPHELEDVLRRSKKSRVPNIHWWPTCPPWPRPPPVNPKRMTSFGYRGFRVSKKTFKAGYDLRKARLLERIYKIPGVKVDKVVKEEIFDIVYTENEYVRRWKKQITYYEHETTKLFSGIHDQISKPGLQDQISKPGLHEQISEPKKAPKSSSEQRYHLRDRMSEPRQLEESLRGVKVCGETVLEISGNKHQEISWDGFGFHLSVPDGAVPSDVTVSLAVKAIMSGQFQLPDDTRLVSSIYWVSSSRVFDKEVSVHIEHCAIISSEEEASNYKFIVGKCFQNSLPYTFKICDAVFSPQSRLGTINISQFSFLGCIKKRLWGSSKRSRQYMSYCFTKSISRKRFCWKCEFIVTLKLTTCRQMIKKMYEGWDLHHWAEVEFEEEARAGERERLLVWLGLRGPSQTNKSITLEITPPSEEEAKIWDCYASTSPKISEDSIGENGNNGEVFSSPCQVAVNWNGPHGVHVNVPIFKRRINLKGARSPGNYFVLQIIPSPPPSPTASEPTLQGMLDTLNERRELDVAFTYDEDSNDISDILRFLGPTCQMFHELGRGLNLKGSVMDVILHEANRCTPYNSLVKVLTQWLAWKYSIQRFGRPSLSLLVKAVYTYDRRLAVQVFDAFTAEAETQRH